MSSEIYKSNQETDFRQRLLVFVDIETTGFDFLKHEIIEIACLVVDPQTLEVKGEYCTKVKPEHLETADPEALRYNNYSEERWFQAKPLKEVLKEINRFAPGGMFVGHNVSFDRLFIEKAVREKGISLNFDYHWLDTASIAYQKLFRGKEPKKLKLTHVCEALGIPHAEAHTALGDAKLTLEVYRYLKKKKGGF